jgi:hypothetical protein
MAGKLRHPPLRILILQNVINAQDVMDYEQASFLVISQEF